MRRLSSSVTLGYKVIFPAIWLTAFGATTLFLIGGIIANLWRGMGLPRELIALTVAFSIGTAAGVIFMSLLNFPLKHVSVDGGTVRIEGLKKKVDVLLTDIAEVHGFKWAAPELITLVLKRDTLFGRKIKFTPGYRLVKMSDHPVLTELEVLVKEANQSPKPMPRTWHRSS